MGGPQYARDMFVESPDVLQRHNGQQFPELLWKHFFSVEIFLSKLTSEVSFSARIFAVECITKIAGSGMWQTVEVSCAKMCQVSMTWVGTSATTLVFFQPGLQIGAGGPHLSHVRAAMWTLLQGFGEGPNLSTSLYLSMIQKHFFMLNVAFG